jgi:hypothetical protein
MATCIDLGDPDPTNKNGLCHSRYKTECGRRLALEVNRLLPPPAPPPSAAVAAVAGAQPPRPVVSRGPTVTNISMVADKSSRSKYSILVHVENGDGTISAS